MRLAAIGIGAAAALLGCIENPEPDPRLFIPEPERTEVAATNQDLDRPLVFIMTRDSGRVRLSVWNPGLVRVDSLRFLLEMWKRDAMYYMGSRELYSRPLREYFASLGAIEPGGTGEVGVIDSIHYALNEVMLRPVLFALSVDGIAVGEHRGYAFRGSFQRRDSLGNASQGTVRGSLDNHGNLDVAFYPERKLLAEEILSAWPRESGAFSGSSRQGPNAYGRAGSGGTRYAQGRLHTGPGEPFADFLMFAENKYPPSDSLLDPDRHAHDSLHIRIEPHADGD